MKVFRFIPYSIRERAALLIAVAALGVFTVISVSKEPQPSALPEIKAATWLTSTHDEYKSKEFWVIQKKAEPAAFAAAVLLCESVKYENCAALRMVEKP